MEGAGYGQSNTAKEGFKKAGCGRVSYRETVGRETTRDTTVVQHT